MKPPRFTLGTVIVLAAVHALAQVPQEFPPNAASISADQLKERLTDRVFTARMTDGKDWRWEWKSSGYIFLNISGGYSDSGKWRTEDGKVCVEMNKSGASCSDMRMVGDVLYLKRASNGEVIGLQPK
ncbi:MAG: hypothetical protein OEU94_17135 [Aquincola sp.]|nr:hypothetical protein [Aquincola sp.]